jgi:AbiV family abortive infection protein
VKIPDEELKKGGDLCFMNASSLIEDAKILVEHGSYGHARFLALSAIEEIYKAYMYALNRIEVWDSAELAHDTIHHEPKFALFVLSLLVDALRKKIESGHIEIKKPLDIEDFAKMGEDLDSAIKDISRSMREESLYVDYQKGSWLSPFDVHREDTESLIEIAKTKKTEFELLCNNLMSVPIELARAIQKSIDNQLLALSRDQFYNIADALFENRAISRRVYEAILSSKKN